MPQTRRYMSETLGRMVDVPELAPPQRDAYLGLMMRAIAATAAYDGSSYQRHKFFEAMTPLENFAAGHPAQDVPVADLIQIYALQARPGNSADFSTDLLYKQARQNLRGKDGTESAYRKMFQTIHTMDGRVRHEKKFPMPGFVADTTFKEYQPKLAAIADALCDRSIYLEGLQMLTGPGDTGPVLRDQYTIVTIPRKHIQIAVCDRRDAPVYISDREQPAKFWIPLDDTYDAEKIKALEVVNETDLDTLCNTVLAAIGVLPELDKPLRPVAAAPAAKTVVPRPQTVRAPAPRPAAKAAFTGIAGLPDSLISRALAQNTLLAPEENLDGAKALPAPIPYAHRFDSAAAGAKAPYKKQDLDYALTHLMMQQKFPSEVTPGVSGVDFMEDWLIEQIAVFKSDNEGRNPTRNSGPLANHPDIAWEMIDTALSLADRRVKHPLEHFMKKRGIEGTSVSSTPAKKSKLPEQAQPVVSDLDFALTCLKEQKRFPHKVPSGESGHTFMKNWIMEQVAAHREDNQGRNPARESGSLKNHPDIDWAQIDDAIFNSGRNHKIHLDRFIELYAPAEKRAARALRVQATEAFTAGTTTPDLSAAAGDAQPAEGRKLDQVIRSILNFCTINQRFPSLNYSMNTRAQKQQAEQYDSWLTVNEGQSLSGFIKTWTRDRANDYATQNGGASPDENSGPIKGYEPYTWKLLDTCFRAYPKIPTLQDIIRADPRRLQAEAVAPEFEIPRFII